MEAFGRQIKRHENFDYVLDFLRKNVKIKTIKIMGKITTELRIRRELIYCKESVDEIRRRAGDDEH